LSLPGKNEGFIPVSLKEENSRNAAIVVLNADQVSGEV